ncbi:hypothetical protein MHYP_G00165810 [Metynnis hypsauchen]
MTESRLLPRRHGGWRWWAGLLGRSLEPLSILRLSSPQRPRSYCLTPHFRYFCDSMEQPKQKQTFPGLHTRVVCYVSSVPLSPLLQCWCHHAAVLVLSPQPLH